MILGDFMDYRKLLRKGSHHLPLNEIVSLPITELSSIYGFRNHTPATFEELNIFTIYDLATSGIFNNALLLCSEPESSEVKENYKAYGQLPNDFIKRDADFDIDSLCDESVAILSGVTAAGAAYLEKNINLKTIWDLAHWTPFLQARQLLNGSEEQNERFVTSDPEIPDELVPTFNEYPVDSFSYSIYTMMPTADTTNNLTEFNRPLNLAEVDLSSKNLPVRVGGIIRFGQTWTSKGLALGDLLHSLPLASGESTKIAVIDWTRQQGVKLTEDISEIESLSNSVMQTRSLNEITNAVAHEAQEGFSILNSNATVSNTGYSSYGVDNIGETLLAMAAGGAAGAAGGAVTGGVGGAGIGLVAGSIVPGLGNAAGLVGGMLIGTGSGAIIGGVGGAASAALATAKFEATQNSSSNNNVETVGFSSTTGSRSITADMAQNINERTQQHASASRNKKASIVQEVSQSESEKITTRSITNYNHMHALTIQYFEAVQLFSSEVSVKYIDPCIFIPFQDIEKWHLGLIERHKNTLIKYTNKLSFLQSLVSNNDDSSLIPNVPGDIGEEELYSINTNEKYNNLLKSAYSLSGRIIAENASSPFTLKKETFIKNISLSGLMDRHFIEDLKVNYFFNSSNRISFSDGQKLNLIESAIPLQPRNIYCEIDVGYNFLIKNKYDGKIDNFLFSLKMKEGSSYVIHDNEIELDMGGCLA